jgi:hypothetical protein
VWRATVVAPEWESWVFPLQVRSQAMVVAVTLEVIALSL